MAAALLLAVVCAGCHPPEVPLPDLPDRAAIAPRATLAPAAALAAASAWPDCNIEQVDGISFSGAPLVAKAGQAIVVTGFLFDRASQGVPEGLRLVLDSDAGGGSWEAPVAGRVRRPDIPMYFKLGAWAADTGVEQMVSLGVLPPGSYHLRLVFSDEAGVHACDNGRYLLVNP